MKGGLVCRLSLFATAARMAARNALAWRADWRAGSGCPAPPRTPPRARPPRPPFAVALPDSLQHRRQVAQPAPAVGVGVQRVDLLADVAGVVVPGQQAAGRLAAGDDEVGHRLPDGLLLPQVGGVAGDVEVMVEQLELV